MTQPKPPPHNDKDFQGYTLEELRYMRAFTAARMEINRDHFRQTTQSMLHSVKAWAPTGLVGSILGKMSYFDMGMLAYKGVSRLFKGVRWLAGRGKEKKLLKKQ